MRKFASFKFNDANGINKLTEQYPLSEGTNVFVSNGEVLIQYDDGGDVSNSVKVIGMKESINAFNKSKAEIEHSNEVLLTLVADAENRLNVANAEVSRIEALIGEATANKQKKVLRDDLELAEKTVKECKASLHEVKSARLKNDHEIERINLNIEMFEEKIAALK